MASITIRSLDDGLKRRLRIRAAQNNRSMEEEARQILRAELADGGKRPPNLIDAVRRRIEPLGGVELPEIPREPMRDPPNFEL